MARFKNMPFENISLNDMRLPLNLLKHGRI